MKIVKPNVKAISTVLRGSSWKLTTDPQPNKLRSKLPRNSASSAFHMLLFFVFSSLIPSVSLKFPIVL